MSPYHSYGDLTAPSRPLDRDKLSMVPRGLAAEHAHAALNAVQREMPEVMVMSIGILFATVCSRCGIDPHDLHQMANRLLRDQEHHRRDNDSLQSMRDFAGIRIMGEREVSIS